MAFIAPIVEGHGEVEALPPLLRRLTQSFGLTAAIQVNPPIRVKAGSFLRDPQYFDRYVQLAAFKAVANGGLVLILLDCDDECPAQMGPQLLARAQAVRQDASFLVALARREFETWFLAAAESLRGRCGLPTDLARPANFEAIRDAKGWLNAHMPDGYAPIAHQHLLAKAMNLDEARAAGSFQRLTERLRAFFQV